MLAWVGSLCVTPWGSFGCPFFFALAMVGCGMSKKLTVTYLPLDELKPDQRNSRKHTDAQIAQVAASIKEFGWTNPILIDERKGIIAGHARYAAAQLNGEKTVPTITLTGLTKAQKRAYLIADNKLSLQASWDTDILLSELDELLGEGFDPSLIGFTDAEIEELRKGWEPDEELAYEPKEGEEVGRVLIMCRPRDVTKVFVAVEKFVEGQSWKEVVVKKP